MTLTPKNSSIPPSTVQPHAKLPIAKPRARSKRKQGGQPGHKRATRSLVPTEDCDSVEVLHPTHCRRCQKPLSGNDSDPLRHQVVELPVIKPIVTEYQRHRLVCPCCGVQTCAPLPAGVPVGQCGPRLAALTGLLMGHFRQSKRRAASFLSELLQIPCSPSWMVKIQNTVSNSLEVPYNELQKELSAQPQLCVDESPTNNAAERALPPAVIYRKLSFGTQSASGSRFIERMLTVTETCRLQNRSTFEFMVEAVEAHYNKTRAPTLLRKKRERSRRKVA